MDVDTRAQIQAHAEQIAALLYAETDPEEVKTLEGIEVAVRTHLLETVGPDIGHFLSAQAAARRVGESGASKASSDR